MAQATTTVPVYDHAHGGHDRTDPRYTEVGYDVIRSTWGEGQPTVLEVTAVVHGAGNYLAALEAAKTHRAGPGTYGFTATRYACGCRWIANHLEPCGANPAPVFRDHPDA